MTRLQPHSRHDSHMTNSINPDLFQLRFSTPKTWVDAVLDDFPAFLNDHAQAEKKASGMAMSMLSHYPDKPDIVKAMVDLAIEELAHFREVIKLMHQQDQYLGSDEKDPYVNSLRKEMRNGTELYLLDRLLIAGIIEARGCERFGMVAEALPAGDLQDFYRAITDSEEKHYQLFIHLAHQYFAVDIVNERLNTLLDVEAKITADLIISAALH